MSEVPFIDPNNPVVSAIQAWNGHKPVSADPVEQRKIVVASINEMGKPRNATQVGILKELTQALAILDSSAKAAA